MNIINTPLSGVMVIEPRVFHDERGYFFESYNDKEFKKYISSDV
ncbi:dTDP-4-dehydrorhamnose 3,5-epimerase family protein, partial [Citrobacter freundii]